MLIKVAIKHIIYVVRVRPNSWMHVPWAFISLWQQPGVQWKVIPIRPMTKPHTVRASEWTNGASSRTCTVRSSAGDNKLLSDRQIDRQIEIYIHHQCAVAHIYACVTFSFQLGAVAIISWVNWRKKRLQQGKDKHACMQMTHRANHYIAAKSNRLRPWCQYSPTYCAPMLYATSQAHQQL